MPTRYFSIVALLTAAMIAGLACSSWTETEDDPPAETPAFDARQAFEASADWLPRESTLVFAGTDPEDRALIDRVGLPTADPDDHSGTAGTVEGLRTDLETLFTERLGFNAGRAEAVVIGAHLGGVTAVLLGDFDEPQGLTPVEIEGQTAYEFGIDSGSIDRLEDVNRGYLLKVESPHPGLVVTASQDQLKRLVEGQRDDSPGHTLRDGSRGERFEELFDQTEFASLAVAVSLRGIAPLVGSAERPLPDAALFDYGETAALTMEGADDDLEQIDTVFDDWLSERRAAFQKRYEERDEETLVGEFATVYGYHGIESIAAQLDPQWGDRQLRYEVRLTETNWGAFTLIAMSIVAGLWDIIAPLEDFVPPTDEWTPREVDHQPLDSPWMSPRASDSVSSPDR